MKQNSIYLLLTALLVTTFAFIIPKKSIRFSDANPSFTITAKIDTVNYKMAYLAVWEDGDFKKLDSCVVENGEFKFNGKVNSPKYVYILFVNGKREFIPLFLENSAITITGTTIDRKNILIKGSSTQTDLEDFNKMDDVYEGKLRGINHLYDSAGKAGNKELCKEFDLQYDIEDSIRGVFVREYLNTHNNSITSAYILQANYSRFDVESMDKIYSAFSDKVKMSDYGKEIDTKIKLLQSIRVGQPAPLFTMNDENGKPVSLESFKGNYVMIDFWASWCNPCRAENPNVVKAYNQFHPKGFQILGVSLDKTKEKWTAAIKKDGLTWTHVSDLKGWSNEVALQYSVSSIPHSVLIDKNGIIVANDLKGDDLVKKLTEIYGE